MGAGHAHMAKSKHWRMRAITISGRKSTVAMEDAFWDGVKEIAATKGVSATKLVSMINHDRETANLSSAIRLFVLDYYRRANAAHGH